VTVRHCLSEGGEAWAQSAQRTCRCADPGGAQGQKMGPGQPELVGAPRPWQGLELGGLYSPLQHKAFKDSVILWENRKVNDVLLSSLISSCYLGSTVIVPSHPPVALLQSRSVFALWPFYRDHYPTLS